ncbi:hypothetical protein OESDEN_00852 [Oesophagostomum dentatum]|uniref:Acetyl-coenzyme A transporter 1 n=1 Tax=Oesophagostomum dentatum TaxID=61180 RepID=A0A0B1TSV3_OESDE|nr:hypothetical protein OESDEN_00852 [Oesophagostomum dentatum]
MASRVRRRNRGLSSSGDVMATEPDLRFSDAGPHVPMLFHRSDSETDGSLEKDISVDSSGSWFSRTRETLRGDISSICLLLFLYLLQGVPLGLIGAIPLLLQGRNVSYGQQAVFSFAYWPFSMKLLWAPIVDSVYWKRIGRRKSWMVPCQYLIGIFMLLLSFRVPYVMGEGTESGPNVLFLMLIFLPLNFLAATQDIAVDGWALTILSRKNVGYASTCNAVGQTAGYFLGNVVFLSLESADFANTFLRSAENQKPYGLIDLAGFVFFWGWVFIVSTTLVLIFKKEVDNSLENSSGSSDDDEKELDLGIAETYTVLWKILKLKPMLWMLVVLLTGKIAFAATDGITGLKLIDFASMDDWKMDGWTKAAEYISISISVQVATYCMFVSMMAFNAQISDPRIGGTYMTLLNTLNNLGGNWPVTLILSVTDWFTYKDCVVKGTKHVLYSCNTKTLAEQCTTGGDVCEVAVDGYYIAVALCSVIGLIWYKVLFNKIKYLQKIPRKEWSVIKK